VVWTGLIWLRIGISGGLCEHGSLMNIRVPQYAGKLLNSFTTGGFSRTMKLVRIYYYLVTYLLKELGSS
jgi:hypothetical protein